MCCLVPAEQVAGVDLVLYVIEARVITVRDNGVRALLELIKVVDHFGAKEGRAVFERGFIDDNRRTLGLDALHHTLNGALAEVVGVGLHGQAIHTNHGLMFLAGIPFAVGAIGTSKLEYAVGDEVFTGGVRIHDRLDEVLRHVLVVGEQLLRVLRQAVAAVTEARVVVMRADARVGPFAVWCGWVCQVVTVLRSSLPQVR